MLRMLTYRHACCQIQSTPNALVAAKVWRRLMMTKKRRRFLSLTVIICVPLQKVIDNDEAYGQEQ